MQRAPPPHPAGLARRHAPRTFRADLRFDPARGGRLFHTLNADANMAALHGYVMGLCHGAMSWAKGRKMRFRDPETGPDLLGHREKHARVERKAAARQAAEARVAELKALVGGKRG